MDRTARGNLFWNNQGVCPFWASAEGNKK